MPGPHAAEGRHAGQRPHIGRVRRGKAAARVGVQRVANRERIEDGQAVIGLVGPAT